MPSLASVGVALPEYSYNSARISEIGRRWLKERPAELQLFQRFVNSAQVAKRHFVVEAERLLSLKGFEDRNALFEEYAPHLGRHAMQDALQRAGLETQQIQTLLFTSCSSPSIPAVDALLIENMALSRNTTRLPIYQHGCAGGVVGLGLGAKLSHKAKLVALTSVELCSLVFQPAKPSAAELVGAAIFADGAACALIVPENEGLVMRAQQSYLVPASRHLMGYDIFDDGFHLRLDRELPQALSKVAPEQVRAFLASHSLRQEQISYWLFHPGGIRILEFLEQTFALKPEQARWSRESLKTVGNLSSASILFVLRAFMDSKPYKDGDKILMLGVGPGLTLELVLFEYVAPYIA